MASTVDFWFDPVCPWAWIASRWIMEVEQVRDIDVTWHIMSLSALNEGRDLPEEYQELMKAAWAPARVAAAVSRDHDNATLKRLYDALGSRFHPGGRKDIPAVIEESLSEVGLPASYLDAATNTDFDADLRAANAKVKELVGDEVGTPTISINDVAFFGPVITPIPRGEQAGQLWDGCVLVAGVPGFYEIKRTRTAGPSFD